MYCNPQYAEKMQDVKTVIHAHKGVVISNICKVPSSNCKLFMHQYVSLPRLLIIFIHNLSDDCSRNKTTYQSIFLTFLLGSGKLFWVQSTCFPIQCLSMRILNSFVCVTMQIIQETFTYSNINNSYF